MKYKINLIVSGVMIFGLLIYGFFIKLKYKKIDDNIDKFSVGIISEDLLSLQINKMRKLMDNSEFIFEVTCEEDLKYGFSYASQTVKVEKVIKGDGVNVGDDINIVKITHVFIPDLQSGESYDNQFFNIDFVNCLKKGDKYIVLLDDVVDLGKNGLLFLYSDELYVSPYFKVGDIYARPIESDIEGAASVHYSKVKDYDFFADSDEAIELWDNFCKEVTQKYTGN